MALKQAVIQQVLSEWYALPLHNASNIDEWLDIVIPFIHDAQLIAAAIAERTFLAQLIAQFGDDVELPDIDPDKVTGPILRNGTTPEEAYTRPFIEFWKELKNGRTIQEALDGAASRIEKMLDSDIQRVRDFSAIEAFANENRIVGYRRVLVGAKNCALCIVASTQRYHKSKLRAMHPGCDCDIAPILSFETDGKQVLDQDLLDQVHREIQEKFGISDKSARSIDYRKILLERQHGELGPMLTYSSHKFTGPSVVN